jgi:hypothetical protein
MRPSLTASGNGADRRTAALRQMTADQFLGLGMRQVVYLRAGTSNGERLFVIHGADGVPLVMVDDVETAVEIAAEHGLKFIAVH